MSLVKDHAIPTLPKCKEACSRPRRCRDIAFNSEQAWGLQPGRSGRWKIVKGDIEGRGILAKLT